MISVTARQQVSRPIADVWAYVSDFDNWPSWDPGLIKVRWQPPVRVGSRVEMYDGSPVLRVVSRIVPPAFTVTECEDGRRLRISLARGKSSMDTVYSLDAVSPETTRISRSFEFDGRGIWRLLELMIRRRAIKGVHDELDNLKRILESG